MLWKATDGHGLALRGKKRLAVCAFGAALLCGAFTGLLVTAGAYSASGAYKDMAVTIVTADFGVRS